MRLENLNARTNTQEIPLKSPNLNWRLLICTSKKNLNNFVSQRRVMSGNQTYVNVGATEKIKTCKIGDSHLARINERRFRAGEKRNFVILKCFRRANTRQLDYYVIPALVDEKPQSIILHLASNDIAKNKLW